MSISRKQINIVGDGQDITVYVWEDKNPDFEEDRFSISIETDDDAGISEFTVDDAGKIIKGLQEAIDFIESNKEA